MTEFLRAGSTLHERAIVRTKKEIKAPLQVWGISGTSISHDMRLSAHGIRANAEARLRILERL